MKSYKSFISEAPTSKQAAKMAPDMHPDKVKAALARNKANQEKQHGAPQSTGSATTPPKSDFQQRALPPSKDKDIVKSPADVGADMMRQKNQRGGALAKSEPDKPGALAKREPAPLVKREPSALVRTNQLVKREPSALAKTPPKPQEGVREPQKYRQGEAPKYSPPRTKKTKLTSPKPKARKEGGREGGRGGDYADRGYKKKGNLPLGTRTLANYLAGKALKDRRETKAYGSKAEPGEGPRIQGQQT